MDSLFIEERDDLHQEQEQGTQANGADEAAARVQRLEEDLRQRDANHAAEMARVNQMMAEMALRTQAITAPPAAPAANPDIQAMWGAPQAGTEQQATAAPTGLSPQQAAQLARQAVHDELNNIGKVNNDVKAREAACIRDFQSNQKDLHGFEDLVQREYFKAGGQSPEEKYARALAEARHMKQQLGLKPQQRNPVVPSPGNNMQGSGNTRDQGPYRFKERRDGLDLFEYSRDQEEKEHSDYINARNDERDKRRFFE